MHFALVGDDPDGLALTRTLVQSGRYTLQGYVGRVVGWERLQQWGINTKRVGDVEEILADPTVEAVIVAGPLTSRAGQLRRVLQSERHAFCIHPADLTPDGAYEAALIQQDTRRALIPLLPHALHPGIAQLARLLEADEGPSGALVLLQFEMAAPGPVVVSASDPKPPAAMPGWGILQRLGGTIAEVSVFARGEAIIAEEPLLIAGRFEGGGLFQLTLLPGQARAYWRIVAHGGRRRAVLSFPDGWPGAARLSWSEDGSDRLQEWDAWDPWPGFLKAVEPALAGAATGLAPGWQDEIRMLELDDACRRSVERRRSSVLDYPEASEEVGFKGTMTLLGCGILWLVLILLIAAAFVPWLRWGIVPLLVLFLALQSLRWLAGPQKTPSPETPDRKP